MASLISRISAAAVYFHNESTGPQRGDNLHQVAIVADFDINGKIDEGWTAIRGLDIREIALCLTDNFCDVGQRARDILHN
jgi:hypothetical protein